MNRKKLAHILFSLIPCLLTVLVLLAAFSCSAPATVSTTPTTEANTDTSASPAVTTIVSATTSPDTEPAATSAPNLDISCILGTWEVEMESMVSAANSIIKSPRITITGAEPSIVYNFYNVGDEPSPTPYRMDIWYDDVLIRAKFSSTANPMDVDMHLSGVISSDIYSHDRGIILAVPIEGANQLQVTDIWIDGRPVSDSPIDISDWMDSTMSTSIVYECLGQGRLSLKYEVPVSAVPFYLTATTPRSHG